MRDVFSKLLELSGRTRNLAEGEVLFRVGDHVKSMCLVQQGSMILRRHTISGTTLILQITKPEAILAEASLYSSHYHCDAIARHPTQIHVISKTDFRAQLLENQRLAEAWAKNLALSMQEARYLAEIRTLRTVSERLDAWQSTGRSIPGKGQWQNLAVELGVSREALYRELALARKPGKR